MTIEAPPIWVQGGTYPARIDRMLIAQMFDEGVMDGAACKVTQRGAGANFTVDVAIGDFVIQGDDQALQGNYMGRVTATENATITAAPGSNSRIDLVTLRVNDPNAGGNAGNTVTVVVVAGTASASPVAPALPASSIALATVGPISTGTASITNGIITDGRLVAGRRCSAGTIEMQAGGAYVPNGWKVCDGSAISRTTFVRLFSMIGVAYGVGDGSTTFNIPDLRNRVPVASGTSFGTLGATGGTITHSITQAELPSININVDPPSTAVTPSSLHSVGPGPGSTAGILKTTPDYADNGALAVDIASFTAPLGGSGTAMGTMPPYQVISAYLIRT